MLPTLETNAKLKQRIEPIRLLVLDVDGVLTNGYLYFDNQGNEFKAFNTQDGHGLKLLMRSGVDVAIITGRTSRVVENRARDLGITRLIQGREDKFVALNELLADKPVALGQIAFMGDDLPDLRCMTKVGLALSVSNAHWQVKQMAHWISDARGGEGAVREACDLIMLSQNTYTEALARYVDL